MDSLSAPLRKAEPLPSQRSITAVIMWGNGDSGNVPFEKFEIQSVTDGKQFAFTVQSLESGLSEKN